MMYKGDTQKYVYISIHDMVSRVMNFARNIIGLDSYMNKKI